ncbi:DsbA family protein [Nitrospira sp. Kam-Ns4a]
MIGRSLPVLACALLLPALAGGAELEGLVRDDGRSRGNPQAPVTIIEYSDFTCGFCLKFFRETWPKLLATYIETGRVRFIYRDYPRAAQGPAVEAALAARCAGDQGQYWSMHDQLFGNGARVGPADLLRYAKAVRLNLAAFTRCLEERRYVEAIFQDREEGVDVGFRGTPGFLLIRTGADGRHKIVAIPGAFPYEVFQEQIERLLRDSLARQKS